MTDNERRRTEHAQLPCQNCGHDLLGDGHAGETTAEVVIEEDAFQGRDAVRELPAYICPECNEVTPL